MAQQLASPYSQFFDDNGLPLAGGKVYTYAAGTTTPQASYTDSTGVTPAANPIILDSAGRAQIWLSGYYNIKVTTPGDVQVGTTAVNITAIGAAGDMNKSVYDAANVQEQLVGLTSVQILPNKTLTAPLLTSPTITGTLSLPSATTATTQAILDNSTKLATTAYVDRANQILQQVRTLSGALSTGTTIIPLDDTIPQNTEGDQYMTLSITPKSATSILRIQAIVNLSSSVFADTIAALFQDSTANALSASMQSQAGTGVSGFNIQNFIDFTMVSGTTSATTFKIRGGGASAGTTTFNGFGGARKLGGVFHSSLTITEYAA